MGLGCSCVDMLDQRVKAFSSAPSTLERKRVLGASAPRDHGCQFLSYCWGPPLTAVLTLGVKPRQGTGSRGPSACLWLLCGRAVSGNACFGKIENSQGPALFDIQIFLSLIYHNLDSNSEAFCHCCLPGSSC